MLDGARSIQPSRRGRTAPHRLLESSHAAAVHVGAHALSSGLTFVTNNVKHFRRVVGLKTENWV
jgi:predicted nucleic acid-binding protein